MAGSTERFSSADAGRGAAEQARRVAASADKLREQLARAERQQQAWSAGSMGERLVAAALREACWPALHDQPWPGRPRANLDHLALSSTRIWLIDAKHWTGAVTVSNGVLRQNGYRRTDNLAKARQSAAADVATALGPDAPPVVPVVCLTQAGAELSPTLVDGVRVVGLAHLPSALGPSPQDFEAMPALVTRVESLLRRTHVPAAPTSETRVAPAAPKPPRPSRARARRARRRASGRPSLLRALLGLMIMLMALLALQNMDALMPYTTPLAEWLWPDG